MLDLNSVRLFKDLQRAYEEALWNTSERLITIMREEVPTGNLPGKPEWREQLRDDIRIVSSTVLHETIEFSVGLDYTLGSADYVRGMLVNYGSGYHVGNPAIHTRPGETVWDSDLAGKVPSNAITEYYLPDGFNQEGSEFIENAMKRVRAYFAEILQQTLASFDFWPYVTSDVRK